MVNDKTSATMTKLYADPAYRERHQLACEKKLGIPITIDGVRYPSKIAAQRALNLSRFDLNRILAEQSAT